MTLYANIDWDKLLEKVREQRFAELTLEELFFVGSGGGLKFNQEQIEQICRQANLEFEKVKDKQLSSFTRYELRALLNTDDLQDERRYTAKVRNMQEGTVVRLKKDAQEKHGVQDVTIERVFKRGTPQTTYSVLESAELVRAHEIEKVVME